MYLNKISLSSRLIHMFMSFSLVFLFEKITTFSLSLTHSRISGLKVTHCAETIKKRERELPILVDMVRMPYTWGPRATSTLKPFNFPLIFERLR